MLKIKIFTLLAFLYIFNINAQEAYKVIYKVEPINIIENNEIYAKNKSKRIKDLLENTVEYCKNQKFVLITNHNNSYFTKEENIEIDFEGKSTTMYSKLASLITAFNKQIFVDFSENLLFFKRNLAGKYYNVQKNKFYDFDWNITKDSKLISGLEARKAIGTYYDIIRGKEFEIIAWFIPSIPIPAGPDIYFGLPGLVGEVHLRKAIVKMESIEEINESVIKPSFKDVMPYEEYVDFVSKANAKIKKEYN